MKTRPKLQPLTLDKMSKILAEASTETRYTALLGGFAGLRPIELHSAIVDIEDCVVRVPGPKPSSSERVVPFTAPLKRRSEWLSSGCTLLRRNLDLRAVRRELREYGVDPKDFRHSFAANYSPISGREQTAKVMGVVGTTLVENYAPSTPEAEAADWWKL